MILLYTVATCSTYEHEMEELGILFNGFRLTDPKQFEMKVENKCVYPILALEV